MLPLKIEEKEAEKLEKSLFSGISRTDLLPSEFVRIIWPSVMVEIERTGFSVFQTMPLLEIIKVPDDFKRRFLPLTMTLFS